MPDTPGGGPAQGTSHRQQTWCDVLPIHPAADLFPLMATDELRELGEDIKKNGLTSPIAIVTRKDAKGWHYQLLDGRNRLDAMELVGITFKIARSNGQCWLEIPDLERQLYPALNVDADPYAYVISANIHRRHLDTSQRAMIAARLANMRQGERTDLPSIEGRLVSQQQAAELLNVGIASVERAKIVRELGEPELVAAVECGVVSVTAAADIATQSIEKQREIVARGEREILEAAKEIRAKRIAKQRAAWLARTLEVSKCNAPLPRDRRYPVILADPPWKFEAYDLESGMTRAAEVHYPTMTTEEICALAVADLATPDAALFLWATSPHLEDALRVIEAWGFTYRTNAVWVKESPGLGYWVRNQHETLLIAARGNMRSPSEGTRPPSSASRREHSRKPDETYQLIERMYPELPKIELFARGHREGWDRWGNEAPAAEPDIPDFLLRMVP
jgi:N6-adenosine-specific RNA methylase IME4